MMGVSIKFINTAKIASSQKFPNKADIANILETSFYVSFLGNNQSKDVKRKQKGQTTYMNITNTMSVM